MADCASLWVVACLRHVDISKQNTHTTIFNFFFFFTAVTSRSACFHGCHPEERERQRMSAEKNIEVEAARMIIIYCARTSSTLRSPDGQATY